MHKQVHYLLHLLNTCTNMSFDFVRLLLCYRAEEEPEGRREVYLVLDFKMNVIKWKLHFVSCNFGLKSNLWLQICNHAFDFRPNCTPLSAITITYTTGPRWLVAATYLSLKWAHILTVHTKGFVAATCCNDLSPRVCRPYLHAWPYLSC